MLLFKEKKKRYDEALHKGIGHLRSNEHEKAAACFDDALKIAPGNRLAAKGKVIAEQSRTSKSSDTSSEEIRRHFIDAGISRARLAFNLGIIGIIMLIVGLVFASFVIMNLYDNDKALRDSYQNITDNDYTNNGDQPVNTVMSDDQMNVLSVELKIAGALLIVGMSMLLVGWSVYTSSTLDLLLWLRY